MKESCLNKFNSLLCPLASTSWWSDLMVQDLKDELETAKSELAAQRADKQDLQRQLKGSKYGAQLLNRILQEYKDLVSTQQRNISALKTNFATKLANKQAAVNSREAGHANAMTVKDAAVKKLATDHARELEIRAEDAAAVAAFHDQQLHAKDGDLAKLTAKHAQQLKAKDANLAALTAQHAQQLAAKEDEIKALKAGRANQQERQLSTDQVWIRAVLSVACCIGNQVYSTQLVTCLVITVCCRSCIVV